MHYEDICHGEVSIPVHIGISTTVYSGQKIDADSSMNMHVVVPVVLDSVIVYESQLISLFHEYG